MSYFLFFFVQAVVESMVHGFTAGYAIVLAVCTVCMFPFVNPPKLLQAFSKTNCRLAFIVNSRPPPRKRIGGQEEINHAYNEQHDRFVLEPFHCLTKSAICLPSPNNDAQVF